MFMSDAMYLNAIKLKNRAEPANEQTELVVRRDTYRIMKHVQFCYIIITSIPHCYLTQTSQPIYSSLHLLVAAGSERFMRKKFLYEEIISYVPLLTVIDLAQPMHMMHIYV